MHVGTEESICSNCGGNEPFPLSPFLWKRTLFGLIPPVQNRPIHFPPHFPFSFFVVFALPHPKQFPIKFSSPPPNVGFHVNGLGGEGGEWAAAAAFRPFSRRPTFRSYCFSSKGGGKEHTRDREEKGKHPRRNSPHIPSPPLEQNSTTSSATNKAINPPSPSLGSILRKLPKASGRRTNEPTIVLGKQAALS